MKSVKYSTTGFDFLSKVGSFTNLKVAFMRQVNRVVNTGCYSYKDI